MSLRVDSLVVGVQIAESDVELLGSKQIRSAARIAPRIFCAVPRRFAGRVFPKSLASIKTAARSQVQVLSASLDPVAVQDLHSVFV